MSKTFLRVFCLVLFVVGSSGDDEEEKNTTIVEEEAQGQNPTIVEECPDPADFHNDFLSGVYYVPGIIGIPGDSAFMMYSDLYNPIHKRDMPLLQQLFTTKNANFSSKTVTVMLQTTPLPRRNKNFYNLLDDRGISMIINFGLQNYHLSNSNFRDLQNIIVKDFGVLVNHTKNHNVVAYCIGDVGDSYLQLDIIALESKANYVSFHGLFRNLVSELIDTARKYGKRDQEVFFMVATTQFGTDPSNTEPFVDQNYYTLPFDRWVYDIKGMTEDAFLDVYEIREELLTGNKTNVLLFGTSAIDTSSHSSSAMEETQFGTLDETLAAILLERDCGVTGYVIFEWSDQVWRNDDDFHCGRDDVKPFFHSNCGSVDPVNDQTESLIFNFVQWKGITLPFDFFGSHCIRSRPTFENLGGMKTTECTYVPPDIVGDIPFISIFVLITLGLGFFYFARKKRFCESCRKSKVDSPEEFPLVPKAYKQGAESEAAEPLVQFKKSGKAVKTKLAFAEIAPIVDAYPGDAQIVLKFRLPDGHTGKEPFQYEIVCENPPLEETISTTSYVVDHLHNNVEHEFKIRAIDDANVITRTKRVSATPDKQRVATYGGEGYFHISWVNHKYGLREHILQTKNNVDSMIKQQVDYFLATGWQENQATSMAHEVCYNRMMEGFLIWVAETKKGRKSSKQIHDEFSNYLVDGQGNYDDFTHKMSDGKDIRMYCLIFLFRLLSSVGEFVIHCPERLAHICYDTLKSMPAENHFVIDVEDVHRGLKEVNEGTINFDDLNAYSRDTKRESVRKYWKEPVGILVIIDAIRNYLGVIFAKIWVFALSFYVYLKLVVVENVDGFASFANFVKIELAGLFICEVILTIYYRYQNAIWTRRQTVYFLFSFLSGGAVFFFFVGSTDFIVKAFIDDQTFEYIAAGYGIIRLLSLIVFLFGFDVKLSFPGSATYFDRKSRRFSLRCTELVSSFGEIMFWVLAVVGTVAVEAFLIIPILTGIDHKTFCGEFVLTEAFGIVTNHLIACYAAVGATYLLVALAVLTDTFLIFNLNIAIFGYIIGESRDIVDVFTSRYLQTDHKELQAILGLLFPRVGQAERVWHSIANDLRDRWQISALNAANLKSGLSADLDFSKMESCARDRLAFFIKTTMSMVRNIHNNSGAYKYQLKNMGTSWIPKVTQIITSYQEDIFKDIAFLVRQNGTQANIDHFILRYRAEWKFLAQYLVRHHEDIRKYIDPPNSLRDVFVRMNTTQSIHVSPASREIINTHVREWASCRSQTVTRTLRGAISSHRAIDVMMDLHVDPNGHHLDIVPEESRYYTTEDTQNYADEDGPEAEAEAEAGQARQSHDDGKDSDEVKVRGIEDSGDFDDDKLNALEMKIALEQVEDLRGGNIHATLPYKLGDQTFDHFVEVIWAHQLYGYPDNDPSWKTRRLETDTLLRRYKDYPITIVFYWKRPPREGLNGSCNAWKEVVKYWRKRYGKTELPKFACVAKRWVWKDKSRRTGSLNIVRVIPLLWPERLGPGGAKTQGKATNQCNAVRFVSGHVIQVMDANMDSYIGEGCKVPFVSTMFTALNKPYFVGVEDKLAGFLPDRGPMSPVKLSLHSDDSNLYTHEMQASEGVGTSIHDSAIQILEQEQLEAKNEEFIDDEKETRTALVKQLSQPLFRVIGFREYIFTETSGAVGEQMAQSESTFGTIYQRTLADPLNVRMHYGHPDFFDAFWIINRGMLSKGSALINLSEDIFAGYNIFGRGEQNLHVDVLEWQKGREETFVACSGFLSKISAGAVATLRSRDLDEIHRNLKLLRHSSSYFGGISYFVSQLLIDYSITIYVLTFLFLSLAGITLHDIGTLNSALGAEWIVSFGFVTTIPLMAEMSLERGALVALKRTIFNFIPSALFFLFQNKMVAKSFEKGILTGQADYVNTGRPTSDTHYGTVLAYGGYVDTHYYPALTIFMMYLVINLLSGSGGALPMILVVLTSTIWILAPVIFMPQVETNVVSDTEEAFSFMTRVEEGKTFTLYGYWLKKTKARCKRTNFTKLLTVLWKLFKASLMFFVLFSTAIDWAIVLSFTFMSHIPMTCGYIAAQRRGYKNGIVFFAWLFLPPSLFLIQTLTDPLQNFGPDRILGTWFYFILLDFLRELILFVVSIFLKKKEERCSEYLFLFTLSYHIHFIAAFVIFTVQALAEIVVYIIQFILRHLRKRMLYVDQQNDWVRKRE